MSAAPTPRPGSATSEPYVSPQLDVAARLNTNECPHPLPEGFCDELARGGPRPAAEPLPRRRR